MSNPTDRLSLRIDRWTALLLLLLAVGGGGCETRTGTIALTRMPSSGREHNALRREMKAMRQEMDAVAREKRIIGSGALIGGIVGHEYDAGFWDSTESKVSASRELGSPEDRMVLDLVVNPDNSQASDLRGRSIAYFCNNPQSSDVMFLSDRVGQEGRVHVVIPRDLLLAIDIDSTGTSGANRGGLSNSAFVGFSDLDCGLAESAADMIIVNLGLVDFAFPQTMLQCLHGALNGAGELIFVIVQRGGTKLPSWLADRVEGAGFRFLERSMAKQGRGWMIRFVKTGSGDAVESR